MEREDVFKMDFKELRRVIKEITHLEDLTIIDNSPREIQQVIYRLVGIIHSRKK